MSNDYAKAKRWISAEQKGLEKYVAAERKNGELETNRTGLASYATGKAHLGHATVGLTYLGSYEAAEGCLLSLHGDAGGEAKIDLACTYAYCALLALDAAYEADTRHDKQPRTHMGAVNACWLHAAAIGRDEVAMRLASIMRRALEGETVAGGFEESPLGTLVAHWATGVDAGTLVARGLSNLGPYEALLGRAPAAAELDALCDEHIARADDESEGAFALYPGSLIPFELLVAARRSSFETTTSSHPLLTWALARPRIVAALPRTPEVEGFLRRARVDLSLGDTPGL